MSEEYYTEYEVLAGVKVMAFVLLLCSVSSFCAGVAVAATVIGVFQ